MVVIISIDTVLQLVYLYVVACNGMQSVVAGANSMNAGHSNPGMHLGMGVAAGNAACLGAPGMHQVQCPIRLTSALVKCS